MEQIAMAWGITAGIGGLCLWLGMKVLGVGSLLRAFLIALVSSVFIFVPYMGWLASLREKTG